MTITTTELPNFGIEYTGASGHQLVDRKAADECKAALDQYGVVVFREIRIADADLVAFSRLLGEVVPSRTSEHEFKEIDTISLDPARIDETLAYYRRGNFLWHIDGATQAVPQQATLLSAQAVDPAGGDTEFANTFLAYEALPTERQDALTSLRVHHSFAAAQHRAHPDATEEQREMWARVPARIHPLVWTRSSGRRSMLLGATADTIVDSTEDDGGASVLEELLAWATQPQFTARHQWREGDLVIFDNTGMLHRATPFEATSRRLLHRTTIEGTEAVG